MISIVTVNFNGSDKTIKLVESLNSQSDKDFKVYLVDNASEEADFNKLLELRSDSVEIIENHQNLGFSGGNNVGIKKAIESGSDWVILLNNDTWVGNDFISRLKTNLSGKGGLIGLPVAEGDKTAFAGLIEWLKPTLNHNYTRSSFDNNYAIGAAIVIHRSVFERVGMLDENYFLYFEDADFSIRAKEAGIPISFPEEPKVNHSVSNSTSKLGSPLLLRYHYRNALYFNFKNGPVYIKAAVPVWSFFIVLKQIIKLATGKNDNKISKAILKGVFDFHLNKMGKIND